MHEHFSSVNLYIPTAPNHGVVVLTSEGLLITSSVNKLLPDSTEILKLFVSSRYFRSRGHLHLWYQREVLPYR